MFKPSWALLLSAVPTAVSATDAVEHISVYANRTPVATSEVLASVSVLDRADIEARQASDLPALLAQLPGITISRDGGRGQNSGLYLRGGNNGHTLVLIDGVRSGSATLGYKTLSMLPLALIERIEVIRGPRAAWYGADALAGVIAITTRQASGVELTADVGSYGQAGASINASQHHGDLTLSATAGYSRADGFNVRNDLDNDRDGYQQRFAKLVAAYQTRLGLWRGQVDVNSGFYQFDTAWGSEDQAETLNRSYLLGWEHQQGSWQHQAQFSRTLDDDTTYGPVSQSPYVTERDEFNYQTATALTDSLSGLAGVNWYQESVARSGVAYVKDNRLNRAAFAGLQFAAQGLRLDGAVRRDLTDQYGGNTTWQFAAGVDLSDAMQLRVSRGSAFKAPTFNDLYYPGSANPDLQPEKTLSNEIALSYQLAAATLQLAWFKQDVDNLIQFDFATYTPQNIERAKISGVELSVDLRWDSLEQTISYSWLDTENTLTGQRLARRPEHNVNWRLTQQWQQLSAFVTADYQSDTYQGEYASSPYLGGFTVFGVGGSFALSPALSLSAKVDNLFDKHYQTSSGYETAGVNFGLSLQYKLP